MISSILLRAKHIKDLETYIENLEIIRRDMVDALRQDCPHPRESVVYCPDASGNNDWSNRCKICGKNSKRLWS